MITADEDEFEWEHVEAYVLGYHALSTETRKAFDRANRDGLPRELRARYPVIVFKGGEYVETFVDNASFLAAGYEWDT